MAKHPRITASPLNVSYPSTAPAVMDENKLSIASSDDAAAKVIKSSAATDPLLYDLLFPPDGSYPHVEWQDITTDLRAAYGTVWMGVALRQEAWDAKDIDQRVLERKLHAVIRFADITQCPEYDTMESYKALISDYAKAAIKEQQALKKSDTPVAARQGHLMGYGSQLARARAMIRDGSALQRKVQFDEPVNAWTCLTGDRLAHGGDMLTAMTVTDTVPVEIKDYNGKPKTVYQSKAVTV